MSPLHGLVPVEILRVLLHCIAWMNHSLFVVTKNDNIFVLGLFCILASVFWNKLGISGSSLNILVILPEFLILEVL